MKKEEYNLTISSVVAWDLTSGRTTAKMSKKLAEEIKELREKKGYTWRAVASAITRGEDSNQILGMDLCKMAAELLKENWD